MRANDFQVLRLSLLLRKIISLHISRSPLEIDYGCAETVSRVSDILKDDGNNENNRNNGSVAGKSAGSFAQRLSKHSEPDLTASSQSSQTYQTYQTYQTSQSSQTAANASAVPGISGNGFGQTGFCGLKFYVFHARFIFHSN